MRCPKCQYLGFDGQERCRNCGYDFSLSSTLPAEEAGAGAVEAGAVDLPLRAEPTARETARAAIRQRQAAASRTPGPEAFDLPLFEGTSEPGRGAPPSPPDPRLLDARPTDLRPNPGITPTPRPPLAVRRATVEPPRPRAGVTPAPATPESPSLDLDLAPAAAPTALPLEAPTVSPELEPPAETPALEPALEADASERAAPIGARVTAGLIDLGILAAIDIVVVTFTLRLTAVPVAQVDRLPLVPLFGFLALLATGYLAMFTVLTGQTAGKMVAGIRVVQAGGRPVRFGHAVLRAALQVVTVPLLGLGFLPALLTGDRRALYDRLSDTEVIRDR